MEGPIRIEAVAPGRRADGPVLPIRQRLWPIPLAILASGVLVAGAQLAGHRYDAQEQAPNVLWRVDRMTGAVTICAWQQSGGTECRKVAVPEGGAAT